MNREYLYELTYELNAAALEVHKTLGPGLLENIYQKCLEEELKSRKIRYQSELQIPVVYKGLELDSQFRCDFLIEDCIVIETKTVTDFLPVHQAQLLTYMQLLSAPKGILYNFNAVNLLKYGQKTMVNKLFPRN